MTFEAKGERSSDALVMLEILANFQKEPDVWFEEEDVYKFSFNPVRPSIEQIGYALEILVKQKIIIVKHGTSNSRSFKYKPSLPLLEENDLLEKLIMGFCEI